MHTAFGIGTNLTNDVGLVANAPTLGLADTVGLPSPPKPETELGGAAGRNVAHLQRVAEAAQLVALNPSDATLANYSAAMQTFGDAPPSEDAAFRQPILYCVHDGLARRFKEINQLEIAVCATCAVARSGVREVDVFSR